MEKTDWLKIRSTDFQEVIRLAAELRDFPSGSELQRRHFLARVGDLVGASVTIWLDLEPRPHGGILIASAFDQGWSDDKSRVGLCEYLAAQSEVEDPTVVRMQQSLQLGMAVARGRRQLADDKTWYGSLHFQKYRRAAGLDECVYSTFLRSSGFQTFSLHRPLGDKRFTESEVALVGAVHTACSPLLDDAALRVFDVLSPRLRQTLEQLLVGLSEKEVARELDVSPHTLHGYIKTLYRRLGVTTRFELMARYGGIIAAGCRWQSRH